MLHVFMAVLLSLAGFMTHYIADYHIAGNVINGKIISFEESLLPEDATITVKDNKTTTRSLADGSFSLEVGSTDKFLVVTPEGYQQHEVALTCAGEYNIVLRRPGS